ncbi:hypothetical protein GCM10009409_23500 [Shewanella saliphila]|uniref:Uncharacterized protein n=1 Tax=Shewanella saliphila TaxID=2282698 RepID=A0ABQ2Q7M2_9GAMM|nr:hypothetical protein GCM10009409_23500 [Shewanella saliphila]
MLLCKGLPLSMHVYFVRGWAGKGIAVSHAILVEKDRDDVMAIGQHTLTKGQCTKTGAGAINTAVYLDDEFAHDKKNDPKVGPFYRNLTLNSIGD